MARHLLATTALQAGVTVALVIPAAAQPAPNARPMGGVVAAGSASISQATNTTTITQSTQRAAVNWQSFNIGSQQTVQFQQPSASAMTLNRVTGPNPSQIAGRIDANGQVVVVNQSGVTFYKGAQVNTNGLVVSAAGITDQNFMAGKMVFDQPGNPNASINNAGTITVKQAGLAALVAPAVANSGVINARLGHVVLAGAKTATLDLYGDGLLSLDVSNQVTQAPAPGGKTVTALVTNTGTVRADGGTVQLTAQAADGIVQNLVQAGGKISAATVGSQIGTVALNGVGGSIEVDGQLSAPGKTPGTMGGDIEIVSNGNVTVAPTARINASGNAGGGVVAIGTTLARAKGGPSVKATQTAANTTIAPGATVSANATASGNGGRVTVLSTQATSMGGTISATGGPSGGNGGFAEVSGVTGYSLSGPVDVTAPVGSPGTILLDPANLEIINSGTPTADQILNSAIEGMSGTIILQANTAIVVDAMTPITLKSGAGLELQTQTGNITIGAASSITASGGGFITLDAGLTSGSGGSLTVGSNLSAVGGVITLQADGGINLGTANLTASEIDLSNISSGGVTQSSGGTLVTPQLFSSAGIFGTLSLPGTANVIGTIHDIDVIGGDLIVMDHTSLAVAGSLSATGTLGLEANGGISLGTAELEAAVALDLDNTTSGGVTQSSAGTIITGQLFSSAGISGSLSLLGAANLIGSARNITVTGGDITVVDNNNLDLGGTFSANNLFFEVNKPLGTLTLGLRVIGRDSIRDPATLTATGRASLVADDFVVDGTTNSVSAGTIELSPFSTIEADVFGSTGLVIDSSMLDSLFTGGGTLEIGGFTNVPAGATASAPRATSVVIDGTLDLSTLATALDLEATGSVTQTAPIINVGSLFGNAGTVQLTNKGNTINALGDFDVSSDLSLNDSTNLLIAGSVAAGGTVTLDIGGALTETGGLTAIELTGSAVGNAALTGSNDLAQLGDFNVAGGPGNFTLDNAANLLISGSVAAGGTATFGVDGALTETGTINVPTLTGSAVGSATLTGNNSVAQLGDFSVTGSPGNFALSDQNALLIAGSVVVGGTATFDIAGALTETGGLTASQLAGSAFDNATLTGSNSVAQLGDFSVTGSPGNFTLDDKSNLLISGSAAAAGTATFDITGALTETGSLTANQLTGSAVGNVALTGNNSVAQLDDFDVTGSPANFAMNDQGNLLIAGSLVAGGTTALDIAGALTETGGINTNVLTGSAIGNAALTGSNTVGQLNGFSVTGSTGSFDLHDQGNLLATGTLSAAEFQLIDPLSQVTLGTDAVLATGGSARPAGASPPASLEPSNGAPGAFIQAASFVQKGSSAVVSQSDDPPTLQISTTGNIQFDPSLGLQANGTWLILDLTTGTATGNAFVNALDVAYTTPGGTNLFGSIGGVTGGPAAATGFIQPAINNSYLFNNCIIAAVTCQPPSTQPPSTQPPSTQPPSTQPPSTPPPATAMTPPTSPGSTPVTTPPTSPPQSPPSDVLTSALGGLSPFLPGQLQPVAVLPNLVLLAMPLLAAPPPQLTDPDVVPPNITYLDY